MFQNTLKEIKLKAFVPERGEQREQFTKDSPTTFYNCETLTGEKAKQFYENILKKSSKRKIIPKNQTKFKVVEKSLKVSKNKNIYKNTDLFKLAENNDVKNLKTFFEQNQHFNINIIDDFHWTPLMCASCSGAEEAVKFLLENGADPNKSDKLGNTPVKLAKNKNFKNIVELLERKLEPGCSVSLQINKTSQSFYCNICNEFFAIDKNKHESSTLHLFNSQYELPTIYGIPESNKGFQLLLKTGWNKDTGLGPHGKGRKFPIQAKIKKDKSGIGISNVSNTKWSLSKPKVKNKKIDYFYKLQEKCLEKKFRREFL